MAQMGASGDIALGVGTGIVEVPYPTRRTSYCNRFDIEEYTLCVTNPLSTHAPTFLSLLTAWDVYYWNPSALMDDTRQSKSRSWAANDLCKSESIGRKPERTQNHGSVHI